MKITKCLEESGLLIKVVCKTTKNAITKQKDGFVSISLGTLGSSFLGNLLTGKWVRTKIPGQGVIRANEGTFRASHSF